MDGVVTIEDATLIQKASLDMVALDGVATAISDVNGDGKVTVEDATLIQKYLSGGYAQTGRVGESVIIG